MANKKSKQPKVHYKQSTTPKPNVLDEIYDTIFSRVTKNNAFANKKGEL